MANIQSETLSNTEPIALMGLRDGSWGVTETNQFAMSGPALKIQFFVLLTALDIFEYEEFAPCDCGGITSSFSGENTLSITACAAPPRMSTVLPHQFEMLGPTISEFQLQ